MTLEEIRSRLIALLSMTEEIESTVNQSRQKGFEPSEEILGRIGVLDYISEEMLVQAGAIISILHG